MKFCILCIGSHGDIRPYVALGLGLKKKGHEVCIGTHQKGRALCEKYGLQFRLVDGDLTELIDAETNLKHLKNKHLLIFKVMKAFQDVLKLQLPMSLDAASGADVLIYGPSAFAGPHLAEYLKIPSFVVQLQPEIKTKFHPSCLFPHQKYLFELGHFLSDQMLWQPVRAHVNRWRKEHLGLKKMHFFGAGSHSFSKNIHRFVAFSPHLVPRPADWGSHIQMTGFCRLFEEEHWTPPNELEQFLKLGPKPIYLGFGSLTGACPKSEVRKIIQSLRKMNLRAIVQSSLAGLDELDLPSSIYPLSYAPHDWLFPRMKAVIHHGGVGTMAAGLYAGVPAWTIPFVWDQFCWGKKLFDLELGPLPMTINNFNENQFEQNIEKLTCSKVYQDNAFHMMNQLNSEPDGVETLVHHLLKKI